MIEFYGKKFLTEKETLNSEYFNKLDEKRQQYFLDELQKDKKKLADFAKVKGVEFVFKIYEGNKILPIIVICFKNFCMTELENHDGSFTLYPVIDFDDDFFNTDIYNNSFAEIRPITIKGTPTPEDLEKAVNLYKKLSEVYTSVLPKLEKKKRALTKVRQIKDIEEIQKGRAFRAVRNGLQLNIEINDNGEIFSYISVNYSTCWNYFKDCKNL